MSLIVDFGAPECCWQKDRPHPPAIGAAVERTISGVGVAPAEVRPCFHGALLLQLVSPVQLVQKSPDEDNQEHDKHHLE
jgi:hypothetical protein